MKGINIDILGVIHEFLPIYNSTDWNMGACLYGFQLLHSRVVALFVAGTSRVFLICFGVHYWFVITLQI